MIVGDSRIDMTVCLQEVAVPGVEYATNVVPVQNLIVISDLTKLCRVSKNRQVKVDRSHSSSSIIHVDS